MKSLDPRPVVAASNNPDKKELNAIPDALGFNMYPGCGSDARREGARDGLNDKGLVGFDHKTRKPVYDFYKTEWNEGR